ncbi:MAG: eRF1 domain 3 protein [Acidobacteria bacterium]|jgi:peptide chain release factor subunit 1|nr:eRF1 domain 3 protein [Acidobacteriota bacterium]
MKLNDLVEKLAAFEPTGFPVVSLYLDTKANENGRDDYQIWLKQEIDNLVGDFDEESAEAQSIKADIERIQNFLETEMEESANGVAIFACTGADGFFETAQLDVAFPNNRLFAFDRPHIFPLVRIIEQNPKYAVLWSDTNKADIYIFGGENTINVETETQAKVEEIENDVTQGTKVGGWSQARYQRHIANFHLQHAKETVEELEKLLHQAKIEYLVLCGDERTIMPILRPQLSKPIEESVVETLNLSQYASEEEIREKTQEVMAMKNAAKDKETVERMYGAAKAAAGLGTMGVEDTLAALSNGQVEELIISSSFEAIKYSPKKVKKVLKAYAPGDDNSTGDDLPDVKESRQIGDELIIRALNSAAKIVFIEDDSLLKEANGVGAVLRYNINATANG